MSGKLSNLLQQASQARREHRLTDAKKILVEAVDHCRHGGAALNLAKALAGLGQIERDLKNTEIARQHYEEAVAIYRAEGDVLLLAHAVRHVGDIYLDEGRLDWAEPCYQEALKLYRDNPGTAPLDLANTIRGFAILKEESGKREEAKKLWEEARALYAAVNVEAGVAESSRRIAQLAK
jgi:tetratricopeptide (TPR) repeat protein